MLWIKQIFEISQQIVPLALLPCMIGYIGISIFQNKTLPWDENLYWPRLDSFSRVVWGLRFVLLNKIIVCLRRYFWYFVSLSIHFTIWRFASINVDDLSDTFTPRYNIIAYFCRAVYLHIKANRLDPRRLDVDGRGIDHRESSW